MEVIKTYKPDQLEYLRILGRTNKKTDGSVNLYWTASGIEFDLHGTKVDIEVEAVFENLEPWISVSLNGHDIIRMSTRKGRHWIPLFNGLDPTQPHHIRILKDTQPMPNEPDCSLVIHNIRFDGELTPLPQPKYRLEFIGDSYTSGEGSLGGKLDTEWLPIWFSASKGYPQLTADLLNGEVRVLSQSGWGVKSSWNNNPTENMPAYYEQVCGVTNGKGGCDEPYHFSDWKPDFIICALGANDMNAIHTKEDYIDLETKMHYKQDSKNLQPLEDAMVAFLEKIRKNNPDSKIFWIFWKKSEPVLSLIKNAVIRRNQSGDVECHFQEFSRMNPDGARFHPGSKVHARLAKQLAEILLNYQ